MSRLNKCKEAVETGGERQEIIANLCGEKFETTGALWSVVCSTYDDVQPAEPKTDFTAMTQGQKDMVTVYSQVAKHHGLI